MPSTTSSHRVPFNLSAESHPRLVKTQTRAEQIAEVVDEALLAYRAIFDSDIPFREATITIKMREDGRGVRAALVSVQGELHFTLRARVDEPPHP